MSRISFDLWVSWIYAVISVIGVYDLCFRGGLSECRRRIDQ